MEGKKGFVITIVIMFFLILGLGGYIAYDIVQEKKAAETKTTKYDDKDIDLNVFFQISDTLDSFDKAFNNPKSLYVGYIYVNKKLRAEKFDMGAAIYASMVSDMTVSNPPKPYYIPEAKVKYNFNKIFGKNLNYQVDQVQSGEVYKVAYYENSADPPVRYDYFAPPEENVYSNRYIAINFKTTLDGDKIIVNRRVCYIEFVPAANGKDYESINIYTDHNKTTSIGSMELVNGNYNENSILAKFGSQLTRYNYTFVPEKGNEYSFYSIEKVK